VESFLGLNNKKVLLKEKDRLLGEVPL